MCDLRIAAPDASFAESFVRVGLISGDGGSWFLPRIIGLARAKEMMLTAQPVDAQKAFAWGLVTAVADEGKLIEAAREMAEQIVALPPNELPGTQPLLRGAAERNTAQENAAAAPKPAKLHPQ